MKKVTATEANCRLPAVPRDVAQGERVMVTSHGTPGATMAPVHPRVATVRGGARRRLLDRLAMVQAVGARDWARDALHD